MMATLTCNHPDIRAWSPPLQRTIRWEVVLGLGGRLGQDCGRHDHNGTRRASG